MDFWGAALGMSICLTTLTTTWLKAIHRSGMTCDQNIIVFGHTPVVNSHSLYRQQLLPPSAVSAIYFENYPTPQSSAILKNDSLHFK